MDKILLKKILSDFQISDDLLTFNKISSGYINDTFKVFTNNNPKYILQKINSKVFKNPEYIFHNINLIKDNSVNIGITFINSKSNKPYTINNSAYWRLMNYEPGSKTFNTTNDNLVAFESGKVLSNFHEKLKNLDLTNFKEIIPNFHNLTLRLIQFEKACNYKENNCFNEIALIKKLSTNFDIIDNTKLEIRLCHNDSKLNNILFNQANKGLYLIDIDTIMPGSILYDFGDCVRTLVNTVSEEEKDLNKIEFNKEMFKFFIDGFKPSLKTINKNELKLLSLSVALMPFLHGVRALTDHLNGNKYFKVTYENQNLIRAKNLIKFSEIALFNKEYMTRLITKNSI